MLDGFAVSSNSWFLSQLKLGSETDQMPSSPKVEIISFANRGQEEGVQTLRGVVWSGTATQSDFIKSVKTRELVQFPNGLLLPLSLSKSSLRSGGGFYHHQWDTALHRQK